MLRISDRRVVKIWIIHCRREGSSLSRLHCMHRCGLLRQMSHIAWSLCLSVCWSHGLTDVLCKNVWTNRDAVWMLTYLGPRNHVLDGGGQDWTNPFAVSRGYKSVMRPVAKLLWIFDCLGHCAVAHIWLCSERKEVSGRDVFRHHDRIFQIMQQ